MNDKLESQKMASSITTGSARVRFARRSFLTGIVLVPLLAGFCRAAELSAEYLTNSLGMIFKRIAPGTFRMGDDEGSPADTDQHPSHLVTLSREFFIQAEPVEQQCFTLAGMEGSAADVTWLQAEAFAKWLSRKEGRAYRLPTEAEWDYARDRQLVPRLQRREWMNDWHFPYFNEHRVDPAGPASGLLKVVRGDGNYRYSLPVNANAANYGFSPVTFRLVLITGKEHKPAWVDPLPFTFAAVKQSTSPARQGPRPDRPYFAVRAALAIPPDENEAHDGPKAGVDASCYEHNHSPGFTVMPNGDVVAIWFSGLGEYGKQVRYIWSRLRYGSEQWDMPSIFYKVKDYNDESPLLWTDTRDHATVWLVGGSRDPLNGKVVFKIGKTLDNGATWDFKIPESMLVQGKLNAQPVNSMFRGPTPSGPDIYFAMDGGGSDGLLWKSSDEGRNWVDTGGRTTSGRHPTIVPLKDGRLLTIGGKNAEINGKQPKCYSSNWGASWSAREDTPFAPLASNQRPDLLRLASGKLFYVGDSQPKNHSGPGVTVALSSDEGETWLTKQLPVTRPHCSDKKSGTAGYVTAAQGPNGIIHILTTLTKPSLHYELNEAWILSANAGDMAPELNGGKRQTYRENYANNRVRATWSARITPSGRYLLDGKETTYYPDGTKESESTYANGRPLAQTYWSPAGIKLWTWTYDPKQETAQWKQYWASGKTKIVSHWVTAPKLKTNQGDRIFFARFAHGPATIYSPDGSVQQTAMFNMGCAGELGCCLRGGWY